LVTGNYTLTVNNVTDRAPLPNAILPNSQAAFSFTPPATGPSSVLRVNAGGGTFVDDQGKTWSADFGFNTGATSSTSSAIAGSANDALFQTERYDTTSSPELTYSFSLTNGDYTVNLLFAEIYSRAFSVGARVFDVLVEGQLRADNLDIFSQAGANTALIISLTVTVSDGQLDIAFVHGVENPKISAIEVLAVQPVADTTAPTIESVMALSATHIQVLFSEPMGTASAQTAGNYSISGGVTVSSAVLGADTRTVTLTTSTLAGGNYTLTVNNVTDRASPANVIASNSQAAFSYTPPVTTPPTLAGIGDKAANESALLSFTATATDPDAGQTLAFALDSGAPAGASISTGGVFTWTPTEAQGPGVYSVTVRVTDSAGGTDSETIQITVNEVNVAPVLAAIGNRNANAGVPFTFTASATDSDVPAQAFTFSLDAGAPSGAVIGTTSGVFTWTPTQIATNTVTVRVTDSAGGTDWETIQIVVTSLPAPWLTADVGSPSATGNASHSNGVYTVQGAGNISGTADNFRFVYQTLSADGEIRARVFSEQNTGNSARAGVMIRESLNGNSKHAMMNIAPNGTFRFQRRTATGGSTSSTTSSSGTFPNAWVRLVRSGSTVTAYRSANGSTWTQAGSVSITMASEIYVGVGVASGSSTTLNTAVFDNITVLP
jgi:regulation of enolase protein 1 (concanavalin A-like superfamily)